MTFEIRQNSTLPFLTAKFVIREHNKYNSFIKTLQNAVLTFSMFDESTNSFIILNKKAQLEFSEKQFDSEYEFDVRLVYKFTKRDTKKVGLFKGEFLLKYTDDCQRELRLPIKDTLYINIKPSMTKTDIIEVTNNC